MWTLIVIFMSVQNTAPLSYVEIPNYTQQACTNAGSGMTTASQAGGNKWTQVYVGYACVQQPAKSG